MKKLLLASVALAALAVAPAFAADVVEEPVVDLPPGFSWTGAYLGVQAGYGWGNSEYFVTSNGATSNPDPDGFLGGVYVGYNYQLNNGVVLGVDADITWTGVDGSDIITTAAGVPIPAEVVDADLNWSGAIRARLGYAVDRFLPYIAGGVAFADYDHTFLLNGANVGEFSDTYTGWTLGAGVEYAFTDNLILRAEYRYSDFGSTSFADQGIVFGHDLDLDTHDVRVGLSYKF